MAHSESHYRAAAHSLGEGFLGSQFDQSGLSESDVSRIHRIAAFREEAELMGLKSGSVTGVLERDAKLARSAQDARKAASQKSKRAADNILFLNLLEQESARLGRSIAEMEAGFEERYGDAWRETIANKVLEPDEIPERLDGESMEDFRERLDGVLIGKMIDPATGRIRPQYLNDPEAAEYAKWAKEQFDKGNIDSVLDQAAEIRNDPNLSEQEQESRTAQLIEESGLIEQQGLYERAALSEDNKALTAERINEGVDATASTSDAAATIAGF